MANHFFFFFFSNEDWKVHPRVFTFTFDLFSNHLHACWRTITMKLQTISFRRGKGSRSAMKMGLKTTRLISFSRRVAVISTPTPLKRTSTRISTIVHLHDSLHPVLLYFSTQKHFTCIHDRMLKQARKHSQAFHTRENVVEERTYIKCVYVLDGMRASRATKWGCHLNKCLISPTS